MTTLRRDLNHNVIQVGTSFLCVNQALTTSSTEITAPANAIQVAITGGSANNGFYYSHDGTTWNYATSVVLEIANMPKYYLKAAASITAELTYNIANWG